MPVRLKSILLLLFFLTSSPNLSCSSPFFFLSFLLSSVYPNNYIHYYSPSPSSLLATVISKSTDKSILTLTPNWFPPPTLTPNSTLTPHSISLAPPPSHLRILLRYPYLIFSSFSSSSILPPLTFDLFLVHKSWLFVPLNFLNTSTKRGGERKKEGGWEVLGKKTV